MSLRSFRSTLMGCAFLLVFVLPKLVQAQAWLPLEGQGQITVTYENIFVRDHFDYRGKRFDGGPIRTHTVVTTFEYGLTNSVTLDADLTHVSSKYEGFVGPVPHGPPDTGFYHPTFQDARFGIRYNILARPLVITPFVATVIPTHHYEVRGHSAVGRGLHELQMGVNVGRELEGLIPRSYIQVRYSFALVQPVEGLNLNRSNADWEFGYTASDRVSLRVTGAWQKTYGGIRYPLDNVLPHFHELHDRAAKSGFVRIGGGLSFSLTKSLDLHGDFNNTAAGSNTHGARGLSLGISWRFSRGGFHMGKF